MAKQPVIQATSLTADTVAAVKAHFDAIAELCPFLVKLEDADRKVLLKVEEENISRPRAVYKALTDNPTLNKSDSLTLTSFGETIDKYNNMYAILKMGNDFMSTASDTVLSYGHDLALTSFEGQKQLKRASEDKPELYTKIYKDVLAVKAPKATITEADVAKLAAKFGYVKAAEEPKK